MADDRDVKYDTSEARESKVVCRLWNYQVDNFPSGFRLEIHRQYMRPDFISADRQTVAPGDNRDDDRSEELHVACEAKSCPHRRVADVRRDKLREQRSVAAKHPGPESDKEHKHNISRSPVRHSSAVLCWRSDTGHL